MMREIRSFPIRFGIEKKAEQESLFKWISEYVRHEQVSEEPSLQLPVRAGSDGNTLKPLNSEMIRNSNSNSLSHTQMTQSECIK
jgi:hypothetical protein